MSWQEAVALFIVFAGLGAGAFLVAQRPDFWVGLVAIIVSRLLPFIAKVISKQMTKEELDEWHSAERRSEGDKYMRDHLKKKLKPIFGRKSNT